MNTDDKTAIGVMLNAFTEGLSFEAKAGKLLVWPIDLLTRDLHSEITGYSRQLMCLCSSGWLVVNSETLGRTIFFAEDEHAREALIVAGAEESSIYTLLEIENLAKANRQSVISARELCALHEAKQINTASI
jgi:hypothetical protein